MHFRTRTVNLGKITSEACISGSLSTSVTGSVKTSVNQWSPAASLSTTIPNWMTDMLTKPITFAYDPNRLITATKITSGSNNNFKVMVCDNPKECTLTNWALDK